MDVSKDSADWKALRKIIDAHIEDGKSRLVGLTDPITIHRTQGRVMAMQSLIDEVEQQTS